MHRAPIIIAATSLATAVNAGTIVQVDVFGSVEFNVIQGNQADVPDGAPVHMSFQLNSSNFVNSPNFPTRGYEVDLTSFTLDVGGQPITIDNPQPIGPAYFVLRDNDPAVDGFFLSRNIDFPQPVGVHIPGLTQAHDLDFLATYGSSTVLSSLDIEDAVGSYDLTGISVFLWTVGRFGNAGAEYNYESMTISIIPTPGAAVALAPVAILALRRRR